MMFAAAKLTERVQSGFKKKSIKGGKWKELVLKMGFDHHSLSLTLPSIMLYFYGKSGGKDYFHHCLCCGQC